jgi:hypothetical protein
MNMNNTLIRIWAAAFAAAAAVSALAAETNELESSENKLPISAEVSVDFMSSYMWRGQICADAPVWQPSATLGLDLGDFGSLSANVWTSFKLTSRRDGSPVRGMGNQEIDYTVSYAKSLGDFDLEFGHIWYTYPNVDDSENNEEFYLSAAYNNDIVTPFAAVYWDYRDNDDDWLFYGNAGLSHEFELCENLTLTPSATLGLGTDAYMRSVVDDVNKTAFLDQTTGVSLAYALTDWLSVGAQVNYTWIVDRDSRRADYMGRDKNQRVWGGINVTASF